MEIDFDDEINKEYEIERFGIGFVPQAEMKDGQLSVTLTQAVEYGKLVRHIRPDNYILIYQRNKCGRWMKRRKRRIQKKSFGWIVGVFFRIPRMDFIKCNNKYKI